MSSKNLPPVETQAPPPDDFANNIDGIGPTVEARLHDAGILSFAQLASMTHNELFELVRDLHIPGMSVERLAKYDWPGKAHKLASEPAPVEAKSHNSPSENRQHYATFHIELLLDEGNNVRRTRAQHIETKKEAKPWPGWDGQRLLDFIQDAALHTASAETAAKPEPLITPKLEITEAEIHTAGGVVSSGIVASDQAWSMQLEWLLSGATADMLTGHWLVRTLLESIGPGVEYSLPGAGPVKVALSDFTEFSKDNQQYRYRLELDVEAGQVAVGVYDIPVTITWEKQNGTPGKLAGLSKGMLQVYTRA
jgi:hypothetical protein